MIFILSKQACASSWSQPSLWLFWIYQHNYISWLKSICFCNSGDVSVQLWTSVPRIYVKIGWRQQCGGELRKQPGRVSSARPRTFLGLTSRGPRQHLHQPSQLHQLSLAKWSDVCEAICIFMARIKQWRGLVLLSSSIIERGNSRQQVITAQSADQVIYDLNPLMIDHYRIAFVQKKSHDKAFSPNPIISASVTAPHQPPGARSGVLRSLQCSPTCNEYKNSIRKCQPLICA